MSSDTYIGNLGRQDFDDTFAENAELTPQRSTHDPSLLTLALCIILPGGLLVLAGFALHRYLKG